MTTKSDFTEDEWARIVRAPFVAGLAISLADPGGPIEAAKETMATISRPPTRRAASSSGRGGARVQAMVQQRQQPAQGLQAHRARPGGEQVLEELRGVVAVVAAKAAAEEAAAFGRWLVAAAQAAADAAKEGGFMGFRAEQVSDREQAMLDQVREAASG